MRRLIPLMLLAALPVWAQNDLQPLPAVPPPPPGMEAFDAVLEPQVVARAGFFAPSHSRGGSGWGWAVQCTQTSKHGNPSIS